MREKKHQSKKVGKPLAHDGGVRFELESNAYELLEENLNAHPPPQKDASTKKPSASRPSRKRTHQEPTFSIDLHGLTVVQAEAVCRARMHALLAEHLGPFVLKVITGRGLHSGERGAVLVREIYQFIRTTYAAHIVTIDPPPADSAIDGVPLRGYFLVHIHHRKR